MAIIIGIWNAGADTEIALWDIQGYVMAPDGPGLGVDIDEEAM